MTSKPDESATMIVEDDTGYLWATSLTIHNSAPAKQTPALEPRKYWLFSKVDIKG
jgi:hypothetical protein